MASEGVMGIEQFERALEWQATHAEENGAPCTARIVRALGPVRESDTATGRRIAAWEGLTLRDALPLRMAGALHHLHLSGTDDRLARVYSGQITDQGQVDALVRELMETYDYLLLPWLDGPPQTNEAGRAASIMAGLLWLARQVEPHFELLEIGASAGVLTMLDRYRFVLGSTEFGPPGSPMRIEPEWRGDTSPPPAPDDFEILSLRGCDIAPVDLADPASALRLKSYVWPDAPGRMARIDAAIALAKDDPPDLVKQDAGAFVAEGLVAPQAEATTRVLFHAITWQYLPAETQQAITAAMEAAGAGASVSRPLAWIRLETDPETFRHELTVRYWRGEAGDGEAVLLARAHAHGAWVEWCGD